MIHEILVYVIPPCSMVIIVLLWIQIGYYITMMNKYRNLANMERKRLEKLLGYAFEEPPML